MESSLANNFIILMTILDVAQVAHVGHLVVINTKEGIIGDVASVTL